MESERDKDKEVFVCIRLLAVSEGAPMRASGKSIVTSKAAEAEN